jgi:hypothetical protein
MHWESSNENWVMDIRHKQISVQQVSPGHIELYREAAEHTLNN